MPQIPVNTAPLCWTSDPETGNLIATDAEGSWEIGAVLITSCPIRFQLALPSGEDRASLTRAYGEAEPDSPARYRLANQLGYPATCQAMARTQDDARIAIEGLRAGTLSISLEQAIERSGFLPGKLPAFFADKTARVFSRKSPSGRFSLEMAGDSIRLEHTRCGCSTTILRFFKDGPTLTAPKTHFWPAHVEMNFPTLAIQAAARAADELIASERIYPRPR